MAEFGIVGLSKTKNTGNGIVKLSKHFMYLSGVPLIQPVKERVGIVVSVELNNRVSRVDAPIEGQKTHHR